jgi:peroxiredoxin
MELRRRDLWVFAVLALAFALLSRPRSAGLEPPSLPALPAPERAAAPGFELPRLGGGSEGLGDVAGRVVVLHFWATWCAPCREELPALQALYAALRSNGLAVLAVSVDAGGPEGVARFAAERGLAFPVLRDPREEVARRYGVVAYPTSVVIDRHGRIVHQAPGAFAWNAPPVLDWFRRLLAADQ